MKVRVKSDVVDNIIELICKNRGVDYGNLERFLYPTKRDVTNPLIYTNLQKLVETLFEAMAYNKKILFVVDSDVDGFCSSAMMINYLHQDMHYSNIVWALHENKEHGLTPYILGVIEESNADVIILPDASSSDYKQHKKLQEAGKIVLVIDHHESEKFSESALVVNNQLDNFGNKTLSGAGMVMKVLEYMDEITGLDRAEYYMDLCATALVGDCMLMTKAETRYYVETGLRNINNPLLFELYKAGSDRDYKMVSFDIAPTINAFIRVGDIQEKNDLFNALIGFNYSRDIKIRGKGEFSLELPEYLSAMANRIKSRQTSEVKKAIDEKSHIIDNNLPFTICVLDLEVNKNLTGLIGNRLTEAYNKPAIVIKDYGDSYKGSARTIDTFPEFKSYLSDLGYFTYCEGHQGAFGLGISKESFGKMVKDLENTSIGEDSDLNLVDKIYINKVSSYEIMQVAELNNYWSRGFEQPLFYIKLENLSPKQVEIIGQKRDTIRIKHDHITYVKFKCSVDEIERVKNTQINSVELIGTFHINEWNDRLYPQVQIEKLEFIGVEIDFQPLKNTFFGGVNW